MEGSRKSAHILVVDDDESILASLRRGLALEGYQVSLAAEGEAALRIAMEQAPDLVILDVMLPGLDGFELPPPAGD